MAFLSGGNTDRIWKNDEVVVLIHAVKDVWTAQMQDPTTLRIWDLIVSRLADAGIQCSSLQAKFKWDSVFSDQMAIAAKTGAEVFYNMSDEEQTRSGLPAKYLKLWFDDISSFIRRSENSGNLVQDRPHCGPLNRPIDLIMTGPVVCLVQEGLTRAVGTAQLRVQTAMAVLCQPSQDPSRSALLI
ncbi:hypothetical protein R1sor_002621 [Riccia sorocarpa]|uniref:Uncharacterized protein n=1 Tax=Riccia sorocarpa TaxID=122646 RepID=A0ABD3H216_9MARC